MVVGTEETLNQRPCCLLLVNRPSRHPIDHDCQSKLLIPLVDIVGGIFNATNLSWRCFINGFKTLIHQKMDIVDEDGIMVNA